MATSKFIKGPDLKRFMDKRLKLHLNGNRKLIGTLRGYDAYLNVVLEEAEQVDGKFVGKVVIRGNSIVQFETLEASRRNDDDDDNDDMNDLSSFDACAGTVVSQSML
eukprot:CAMPEP_0198114940 /NCGR_PEP_ID=MMETSP1442-20131203/6176_1 /TAXON_ID= /ORGANISM="Craspedostauros australis, Strain CCMP3328" /LENGTH=106 /DNA_ID=CAMNT_0043772351 /DNA_START=238 /DNA_END=559 /DNA_ORIENTATION=+